MHIAVKHLLMTLAVGALTAGTGCGKASYGAGCEKKAELTDPWTDLDLPIDEKKTRICKSKDNELKLRSYDWKSKDDAQSAIASALESAGYEKDKCSDNACYYDKDGYQISVQPIDFKVKKKKLQTVVMRYRKDATQKKSKKKKKSKKDDD